MEDQNPDSNNQNTSADINGESINISPPPITNSTSSNKGLAKTILTIIIMAVVAVGFGVYIFGSQYYFPSNYISATGHVLSGSSLTDGRTTERNYSIQFNTNTGQSITYKYQMLIPIGLGSTVPLHYNSNDPEQVRIEPNSINLLAEIGIAVVIEALIFIAYKGKLNNLYRRRSVT